MNSLKQGWLYKIKARNACLGIFHQANSELLSVKNSFPCGMYFVENPGFVIARSKLSFTYLDFELIDHKLYSVKKGYEMHRTAEVLQEIEKAPMFTNPRDQLAYLTKWSKQECPHYVHSINILNPK
jgi:hypothetical protein